MTARIALFIAIVALCVALGVAFGQRTDYLRLQAIGAPDVTLREIFGRP